MTVVNINCVFFKKNECCNNNNFKKECILIFNKATCNDKKSHKRPIEHLGKINEVISPNNRQA